MIKEDAFAKLNLNLHVLPKKSANGFFPVRFLNCQLLLKDEISLENQKRKVEALCDDKIVPKGRNNSVLKAALLLKRLSSNKNLGARIILKKGIPARAGFGGGSSDAAATIRGLLKLWKLEMRKEWLSDLTKELGQDFFYCYFGGLSRFEGKDNRYKVIHLNFKLPEFWVVVVEPNLKKPSSSWMYQHLDPKEIGHNVKKLERLQKSIRQNKIQAIFDNLHNDFESSVSGYFPVVSEALGDLAEVGASGKIMAGAGLSVVGFFESQTKAKQAAKTLELNPKYRKVLVSRTKF